jgi:hypothetical protein
LPTSMRPWRQWRTRAFAVAATRRRVWCSCSLASRSVCSDEELMPVLLVVCWADVVESKPTALAEIVWQLMLHYHCRWRPSPEELAALASPREGRARSTSLGEGTAPMSPQQRYDVNAWSCQTTRRAHNRRVIAIVSTGVQNQAVIRVEPSGVDPEPGPQGPQREGPLLRNVLSLPNVDM